MFNAKRVKHVQALAMAAVLAVSAMLIPAGVQAASVNNGDSEITSVFYAPEIIAEIPDVSFTPFTSIYVDENGVEHEVSQGHFVTESFYVPEDEREGLELYGNGISAFFQDPEALNTVRVTSSVVASRPLIGGTVSATATTESTTHVLSSVAARVRINNGGASISTGTWTRLTDTNIATVHMSLSLDTPSRWR